MSLVEVENVCKRFGSTVAVDNISFRVDSGRIASLLGPSGCGKTTTLRLIAGFEGPDSGVIRVAGEDMAGKQPYRRNVGLLFQDYALFPHMTVEENVAFGLRHRGFARHEIPMRTRAMLDMVKLAELGARRPAQLSGGQQQRVALARALATRPEIMLLDEPLSALDAKLRQELRIELKEILESVGTTTIVVTHDQQEAMSLAEHVVVMHEGRIVQQGSPGEVYSRPRTTFVAEFIGQSNWFRGRIALPGGVDGARRLATTDGLVLHVAAPEVPVGTECDVCVRPEHIDLSIGASTEGDRGGGNVLQGAIVDVSYLGAEFQVVVELSSGQRMVVSQTNRNQSCGRRRDAVSLVFRPEDCIVLPRGER